MSESTQGTDRFARTLDRVQKSGIQGLLESDCFNPHRGPYGMNHIHINGNLYMDP